MPGRWFARLVVAAAWAVAGGGASRAEPGDFGALDQHVEVLDTIPAPCAPAGALCFMPGDRSTVRASSPGVSSAAQRGVLPRFVRISTETDAEWTLDLTARLRRPALAGNAVFIVYDAEDPKVVAEHQVTALYQARIPAGLLLAARLRVSPGDGVYHHHAWRVRIVQLVGGREQLLAEGNVILD